MKVFTGGSAITKSKCLICKKEIWNESTAVIILCDICSKQHKNCKRCGNYIVSPESEECLNCLNGWDDKERLRIKELLEQAYRDFKNKKEVNK